MDTINFQPKKPELHAPLADVQQLFQTYLNTKRKRVKKITTAGNDAALRRFLTFWEQRGAQVDWRLTPDELVNFGDWLAIIVGERTGQPLAWNTRNDAIRRLRQCFRWAIHAGHLVDANWASAFPQVSGNQTIKTAPGLDVLRAIYHECGQSDTPKRDRAIFAILAGTGMRRAECAALKVEDLEFLDDSSGFAMIRTSKTGRGRKVAFDDITGRVIKEYINGCEITKGWLFPTPLFEGDHHLGATAIGRILDRAAARGGVADRFTGSHDIRRSYATEWTRKLPGEGYSWILARQLGHTVGAGMTSYYSKLDHEDIRRTLTKERCSLFALILTIS